jgi:hypothetical protein
MIYLSVINLVHGEICAYFTNITLLNHFSSTISNLISLKYIVIIIIDKFEVLTF